MEEKPTIQELIKDGFVLKSAKLYLSALDNEEKTPYIKKDVMRWAHSNGFLARDVGGLGITENNKHLYLSHYQYAKCYPLNNWQRIWINDKLTTYYMLRGSNFSNLMPSYYFYYDRNGIRELPDNPFPGEQSVDAIVKTLKTIGALACKPNNGQTGVGFKAFEIINKKFFVNGEEKTRCELKRIIEDSKNSIYTELLEPAYPHSLINPLIHTVRIMVLNEEGNNPYILNNSTIRYSTRTILGSNNPFSYKMNADTYGLYSSVNLNNGIIGEENRKLYTDHYENVETHPISGHPLRTKIENHEKLVDVIKGISKYLFGIEWMGFDLCFSTNGVKIMEINTEPGYYCAQIFSPYFDNPKIKEYYDKKLEKLNALSKEQQRERMMIQR